MPVCLWWYLGVTWLLGIALVGFHYFILGTRVEGVPKNAWLLELFACLGIIIVSPIFMPLWLITFIVQNLREIL